MADLAINRKQYTIILLWIDPLKSDAHKKESKPVQSIIHKKEMLKCINLLMQVAENS
jgi:hypothetical protein